MLSVRGSQINAFCTNREKQIRRVCVCFPPMNVHPRERITQRPRVKIEALTRTSTLTLAATLPLTLGPAVQLKTDWLVQYCDTIGRFLDGPYVYAHGSRNINKSTALRASCRRAYSGIKSVEGGVHFAFTVANTLLYE